MTRAPGLLAAGRAALRSGDAAEARRNFEAALEQADLVPMALEGLGRAAYVDLDFGRAIELWERAYGEYREAGDTLAAVRMARTLAPMYGTIAGDWAVCSGWLARAQTLLSDGAATSERGWVALNIGMFDGDRHKKEERLREAVAVGRAFGDLDLELAALAYLGASLVHGDRVEEGMMLLDEALAAVAGNEVDDFCVLEEIFCQLFSACEHVHDVIRADQWMRVGDAIAVRRKLPAVSAFCRTHFGGVLVAAGRWSEADVTLTEAVRLWALGQRSGLRAGAVLRLADLRVRQGRIEEAEQLLAQVDVAGNVDAARPVAALHLARGETLLARDTLEQALSLMDETSAAGAPLLSLLVEAHLANAAVEDAAAVADTLARVAAIHAGHYLAAVAALARGRVCLARGSGDPQACLREALAGFARAQMPAELARSRLELAHALVAERPEAALAEARAALESFERLQAARDVDAAAAIVRSLDSRASPSGITGGILSKREEQVLALLGEGLSNPEISDRLFISRKTVEHHVGNILAKLSLRSRTEAATYAVKAKLGSR